MDTMKICQKPYMGRELWQPNPTYNLTQPNPIQPNPGWGYTVTGLKPPPHPTPHHLKLLTQFQVT